MQNHLTGDFGAFFEYQVMPSFVVVSTLEFCYSFVDVKASDIKGWDDAKKANPNAKDTTLYKSPMDWNVLFHSLCTWVISSLGKALHGGLFY